MILDTPKSDVTLTHEQCNEIMELKHQYTNGAGYKGSKERLLRTAHLQNYLECLVMIQTCKSQTGKEYVKLLGNFEKLRHKALKALKPLFGTEFNADGIVKELGSYIAVPAYLEAYIRKDLAKG